MKNFIKFLQESYEVNFEYGRNSPLESMLNSAYPNVGDRTQTRVFESDRMRDHGLSVVRFHNNNDQIEYHLHSQRNSPFDEKTPPEGQDRTALRHSLAIIHSDAQQHLAAGKDIKIQCFEHRKKAYSKIIDTMLKDHPDYEKKFVGDTPVYGYHIGVPTFMVSKRNSINEDSPCWKGYTKIGLKKKNGKMVPNCVPKEDIKECVEHHLEKNIPLFENDFRIGSEAFFSLYNFIRESYEYKSRFISEDDMDLLNSDLGTFAWYDKESQYVPLDIPFSDDTIFEEEDKTPELNKPKRGGPKKFYVYVKTSEGKIKKVTFGDTTGLSVKFNDPERRKAFAARHDCSNKNDKTTPGYWSCRLPRYAKSLGLTGGGSGFW